MIENFGKNENSPYNSSLIPEKLKLDPINKENGFEFHLKAVEYKDKISGNSFFLKNYRAGLRESYLKEHFVSLLIKGILHASEIVRIGDNNFFSRKINLSETEAGAPLEKEAEIFILNTVLGDFDRSVDNVKHNIVQDENGKFNHYDYDAAFYSPEFEQIHKNSRKARKIFNEFCKDNKFSKEDVHNFSLQIFDKLDKLEQAVKDEKFISAILAKTEFEPPEENIDISKIGKITKSLKKYLIYKKTSKNAKDIKVMRIKNLLLKPIISMKKVAKRNLK